MKRQSFLIVLLAAGSATPAFADYTLNTLATFNGSNGSFPYAGLIADATGNLYGTTFEGGVGTYGTVFEVAAGTHTLTTLASFNQTNGSEPEAGLITDAVGNLYGTTYEGGSTGGGTVFEVAAGTNMLSTLATFPEWVPSATNGTHPAAVLISDAIGNLYGTTEYGGASNYGTVFEVAAGAQTLTTPVTFVSTNGAYPLAGLIADAAGNLYGTTRYGTGAGGGGDGTVFEMSAGTHTLTTLVTFKGSNGFLPDGGLISDAAGDLYGTTWAGGASGDGTVFEVAADTHTLTTLASFNNTNGSNPVAGLVADAYGNLYGTTSSGGADNDGTVFEVPSGGGSIITLATFNGANGSQPLAGLIFDAAGNLYGTTQKGGDLDLNSGNGVGTVFELTLQSATPSSGSTIVSSGVNQSVGVTGGTSGGQKGGVAATFANTTGGTFTVTYDSALTQADLLNGSQGIQASAVNFELPTGPALEAWDVDLIGGSFSGEAQLVFHYDPSMLTPGFDQSLLEMYHFTDGQWVGVDGTVDTSANTITIDTTSFSPFALGIESVPEPTSISLLAQGALGLLARRRRRVARK